MELGRRRKDISEAEERYRQGWSVAEIARSMEPPMSRQGLWRMLKERGVLRVRRKRKGV